MSLFGLPIFAYGGILLLILLSAQIVGGMRLVNIPFKYHKVIAWTILVVAIFHATLAIAFIRGL